ncbi:uncharacterized protein LOC108907580 [Anoplophora glabripennis]|uniref:uncharacterized protein LOC108907580 n=1 Tax=Anoplophora glabripennis TaxID=217634 RepID=UPI0008746576|nr:uncharacterized protein LOC108907580 [Anoplophora glabripennis]
MYNGISPQVCKTLEQLAIESGVNFKIVSHDSNNKGAGYSGEVIFVKLRDTKTHKETNVIVKQALKDQSLRDSLSIRDIYMNEIHFYSKVWPVLDKFQEQIPMQYRFQKLPKYLASVSNENFEYLVMENLKFQHFQNLEKEVFLDKEHYELIMREYGKFHGISFAYKALYPEEYADLAQGLASMFSHMVRTTDFFEKSIKYAFEICTEYFEPGVDDAVIEKLRLYLENGKELFLESIEGKTKYTAITHGDCWSNNMMFKYDDSKKVTDVRFFDLQFAKDGSPCCDLSYCIYAGAPKDVLKNLDYYLQVYHDSLSETLKQFGCNSEDVYPLQTLKKDWKRFCKIGIIFGTMVRKMKFTYELSDFTDVGNDEPEKVFQTDYDKDAFSKSVKDLFYHLVENDFF